MAIKTIPFDAAEHLSSRRAQIELLTDALDSGDAGYVANALGVIARARGIPEVADAGVSRQALYNAMTPDGDPKLSTVMGVLRTLGFKLVPRRRSKVDG